MFKTDCENCNATIIENSGTQQKNLLEYTVCDSCEATICVKCIGEHNECPVCGGELTSEDNF